MSDRSSLKNIHEASALITSSPITNLDLPIGYVLVGRHDRTKLPNRYPSDAAKKNLNITLPIMYLLIDCLNFWILLYIMYQ